MNEVDDHIAELAFDQVFGGMMEKWNSTRS